MAVVALAFFIICSDGADIRRLWLPMGLFGYGTNLDGVVTSVDVDSPAAKAGLQLGDRVVAPPQTSWQAIQIAGTSEPGDSVSFDLVHQDAHRTVTLIAAPEPITNLHKIIIVISTAAVVFIVALGAALVLLRPSPATWGFFFFCLASAPQQGLLFFGFLSFLFYGAHVHGEALDPDEIKAIAGLATGAAAAYDHLEAEAMRCEVDSMRGEIATLRSVIAEAQIQPA